MGPLSPTLLRLIDSSSSSGKVAPNLSSACWPAICLSHSIWTPEASWAAGGILAPQVEADHQDDFFQLACASRDLYPEFAESLKEETGVDVELDTTGTLCLGLTEKNEAELRRRCEWQQSEHLEVEWLNGDEARHLEPCVSAEVSCALRFPRDFQIENRRLISALVRANEEMGIQFVTGTYVNSVRIRHGRVCGVETSNGFV